MGPWEAGLLLPPRRPRSGTRCACREGSGPVSSAPLVAAVLQILHCLQPDNAAKLQNCCLLRSSGDARSGGSHTIQSELTALYLTLAERLAGLAPSVKHPVHCRQHSNVIGPGSSCQLDCGPHCQAPALLGLLLNRLGSSMAGVRFVAAPGCVDCWSSSASGVLHARGM